MKQTAKFHLEGISPVLMHNGQLSDPLNEWSKAIARITSKKKKTDADHEEIGRLEWFGGLYLMDSGPCIPMKAVKATLLRAAMTLKKGPKVKSGLVCEEHALLEYDGPRDPKALWADGRFTYRVTKPQRGQRIVRTRASFFPWATDLLLAFDDETLNPTEVNELVQIAGSSVGFLDERPEYGRFRAHKV